MRALKLILFTALLICALTVEAKITADHEAGTATGTGIATPSASESKDGKTQKSEPAAAAAAAVVAPVPAAAETPKAAAVSAADTAASPIESKPKVAGSVASEGQVEEQSKKGDNHHRRLGRKHKSRHEDQKRHKHHLAGGAGRQLDANGNGPKRNHRPKHHDHSIQNPRHHQRKLKNKHNRNNYGRHKHNINNNNNNQKQRHGKNRRGVGNAGRRQRPNIKS